MTKFSFLGEVSL